MLRWSDPTSIVPLALLLSGFRQAWSSQHTTPDCHGSIPHRRCFCQPFQQLYSQFFNCFLLLHAGSALHSLSKKAAHKSCTSPEYSVNINTVISLFLKKVRKLFNPFSAKDVGLDVLGGELSTPCFSRIRRYKLLTVFSFMSIRRICLSRY